MKKKITVTASVIMNVWVSEDMQGNQEIEDIEDVEEVLDWEEKK